MGYDMRLSVFKKKTINELLKEIPDCLFSEAFSNYLYAFLYPENYKIPEDEVAREICWNNRNVFRDYFAPPLENGAAIIIDRSSYWLILKWLEDKLKSTTLFDYIDKDIFEIDSYIETYKAMRDIEIDWNTEIVVFDHDW